MSDLPERGNPSANHPQKQANCDTPFEDELSATPMRSMAQEARALYCYVMRRRYYY